MYTVLTKVWSSFGIYLCIHVCCIAYDMYAMRAYNLLIAMLNVVYFANS